MPASRLESVAHLCHTQHLLFIGVRAAERQRERETEREMNRRAKNSYVGISAAFNCFWNDVVDAVDVAAIDAIVARFQYLIILRIRAVCLALDRTQCGPYTYTECVLAQ